jgi:eukaryotic-like serine/threonine-protein kinase
VRPYPGPGSAVQISTSGGSDPVWARSGREVFFVRGDAVMAAGVTVRNDALEVASPKALFSGSYALSGVRPGYDVSPDGQRFLMITSTGGRSDLSRFNVALNWQNEVAAKLAER